MYIVFEDGFLSLEIMEVEETEQRVDKYILEYNWTAQSLEDLRDSNILIIYCLLWRIILNLCFMLFVIRCSATSWTTPEIWDTLFNMQCLLDS